MKTITGKWLTSKGLYTPRFEKAFPKGLPLEKIDSHKAQKLHDNFIPDEYIDEIAEALLPDKKADKYNDYINRHRNLGIQGSWNKMISLYFEK